MTVQTMTVCTCQSVSIVPQIITSWHVVLSIVAGWARLWINRLINQSIKHTVAIVMADVVVRLSMVKFMLSF